MSLAALIIGIVGLIVASLSLGWQVAAWTLTGGRVRATLKHGLAMGDGSAVLKAISEDGRPMTPDDVKHANIPPGAVEVLAVDVRYVGRMPVTVERYGSELLAPPSGSLIGSLVRRRGVLSLHPFGNAMGPPLPHRMDPGTSATWLVQMDDVRGLVHSAQVVSPGARSVGMTVELGDGRKAKTRHTLRLPTSG